MLQIEKKEMIKRFDVEISPDVNVIISECQPNAGLRVDLMTPGGVLFVNRHKPWIPFVA